MITQDNYTLINPQNGHLAFKLFFFSDNGHFDHIQRPNYYSLIWVKKGRGKLKADFSEYDFSDNTLMCFSPFQPFMISTENGISGIVLNFHPDFFCIHKHQKEVVCNGVLFNDIYKPPFVSLDEDLSNTLAMLLDQMNTEVQSVEVGQYETLVSYLKIFLIKASRHKMQQLPDLNAVANTANEPFILQTLKENIESYYRTKRSPVEYSDMLHISPKALAKITKMYFNKTITDLIAERVIIEAKRELYLTSKSVKEIAYDLGYDDEHYFSRFFKKNAEVSPQLYRETVGFARGEV